MPHVTLWGIPDSLHRKLKAAAKQNHRSLNGEILARLAASVGPVPVDVQSLLRRVRQRREVLGEVDLSEEALQEMRNAGRP